LVNLIITEQSGAKRSKARSRTKLSFHSSEYNSASDCESVITLSLIKNNYLLAHYNSADLSMLHDFEDLKKHLSIVNKSFVTLGSS